MRDAWTDRLSEHLDGVLDPAEREALEAHLAGCAACTALLSDLSRVRERARALIDAPPERDLWPGIEARIRGDGARAPWRWAPRRAAGRRVSLTIPQLAAAGVALALVSGGAALWIGRPAEEGSRGARSATQPVARVATDAAVVADSGSIPSRSEYEAAIVELKRALAAGRGKLDPATVRTLESNLAIIELAIDQARRALAADPANPYVREHLADTMRRKVELLKRATILASAEG